MQPGDLTDQQSWERAWHRSRGLSRSTWLKKRFIENHHAVLARFFERAGGPRALEVIELGCAPGKLLQAMATVGPQHHFAGVDFAADALEHARTSLAAAGQQPDLFVADVRTFEPPQAYDLAVSFGLIEHFEDPREILGHHARLVRPGGVIGITVPNYGHRVLKRALGVYSPDTLRTHNLDVMSTHALERLLQAIGLTNVTTGSYGGAVMPSARAIGGALGTSCVALATAWNVAFRALPHRLSPWQGYLWACGTKTR